MVEELNPRNKERNREGEKMKVGDKVIIYKPLVINTDGAGWPSIMDKYIGKTVTIKRIGIFVYVKENEWSWEKEWLEDPVLRLINEVIR